MNVPNDPTASNAHTQPQSGTRLSALLDVSEFPLVRPRTSGHPPGYGPLWAKEMDALLARGQPFVLLVDEPQGQESPQDRKTKTLWLKANKAGLAVLCRGFVMVEPEPAKRLALKMQGAVLAKAFELVFRVAADVKEAQATALKLKDGIAVDGAIEG